ncbi:ABC transporter ATP-binding protein [Mycoplasmopsis opalescens]|uniref:ABC transporter ATP-binding protein n=1 Tax=Mycoplasmopsis opalescens TaxID=114886 RepID=UPI0004A76139|nr:ABC transporter ATP-binding protein [Mycoplasmopsis opalescens]
MKKDKSKRVKIKDIVNLFKVFHKFAGNHCWKLYLGLFLSFVALGLYNLGTLMTGLIVSNTFTKEVLAGVEEFNLNKFILFCSILGAAFLLYLILRTILNRLLIELCMNIAHNIRKQINDKLLQMPVSYFDHQKAGDLIAIISNDASQLAMALTQIVSSVISQIFSILISVVILMLTSVTISSIMIVIVLFFFSIGIYLASFAGPAFIKLNEHFGEIVGYVEEILKNQRVANSFNQQKATIENYQKITQKIYKTAIVGDIIQRLTSPWSVFANNILVMSSAIFGLIFKENNLPFVSVLFDEPNAGFFIGYTGLLWSLTGSFNVIMDSSFAFLQGISAMRRVDKILNLENEKPIENPVELTDVKGHIEFNNVYFRYNQSSGKYQLKNATFEAKPGETIAIVGATGAGKTTIINLLSKFYDYEMGSIKIDNVELKQIPKTNLRDFMAVVLQDPFMFNDTIKNNIKIGNSLADNEHIIEAAKTVSAHEIIMQLEFGYDTQLVNDGAMLSKGERQLIAMARAILGEKRIIILDEATSNIDSNTEKIIQAALNEKILVNKTAIVIAHRLSTIKNADKILVVEDGQIVEGGTHEELLKLNGSYAKLYNSQFSQ